MAAPPQQGAAICRVFASGDDVAALTGPNNFANLLFVQRPSRSQFSRAVPQPGDRLFVQCDGGPCTSRLVNFPPPLEIEDRGGIYVLNDDGGQDDWVYIWVASR